MISIQAHTEKMTCAGCEEKNKADISIYANGENWAGPRIDLCASCINKLGGQIDKYFKEIGEWHTIEAISPEKEGEPAACGSSDVRKWTLRGIADSIIGTFESSGHAEFNATEKGGGFSAEEIVEVLKQRGYSNVCVGRDINRTICLMGR